VAIYRTEDAQLT